MNWHLDTTEGLTFDDVLLEPKYSDIESRADIDTIVKLEKPNGFTQTLKHPIVPANMKTIVSAKMAETMFLSGGLTLVHRFMTIDEQIAIPQALEATYGRLVWNHVGLSVGVKGIDREAVNYFVGKGAEILCVDVAHGHSKGCIEMCKYISKKHPEVFLIAGNIATYVAALDLWEAGADAVKAGIGSGALCSTRIETGNGVPQLSAIHAAAMARQHLRDDKVIMGGWFDDDEYKHLKATTSQKRYVIADGGVRNAGDIVKGLAAGADLVMAGNVFAGSDETPGEIVEMNGQQYKRYIGSSTHKTNHIEGVEALVPTKGKVSNILQRLMEGVRSGMSYQGAHNLEELRDKPEFIRVSNSGLVENHPHDVMVIR